MAAPVSVRIVERGLKVLLDRAKNIDGTRGAEIGVINASDPETAMIARVHELGLGTAPQRSFLRATVERNRARYVELSKRVYAKVLDGVWTIEQGLAVVGQEVLADVQKAILKRIPPPLQDATVASKKSRGLPRPKTPLFATGKLYNSIRLRIRGKVLGS